jgi:tRNA pseudouridine55 synthase
VRSGAGGCGPSGLILLRKPEGETSFRSLGPVKRKLGTSRIGHAGTLDRFAGGLLVTLAGSYSRLASYVQAGEKTYRGVARFGEETETLDPEGAVIAEADPPARDALEAAIPRFIGKIAQVPPAYSALHVDGKRAYELALAGRAPQMRPREILIRSLDLVSYDGRDAVLELRCSSGTYVRSLARDLALACGSRAHLVALERLAIGPYSLENAVAPSDFEPARDLRPMSRVEASSLGLGTASLPERLVGRFVNGSALDTRDLQDFVAGSGEAGGDTAVFVEGGRLLGIVSVSGGTVKYKAVLACAEGAA